MQLDIYRWMNSFGKSVMLLSSFTTSIERNDIPIVMSGERYVMTRSLLELLSSTDDVDADEGCTDLELAPPLLCLLLLLRPSDVALSVAVVVEVAVEEEIPPISCAMHAAAKVQLFSTKPGSFKGSTEKIR